MAVDVTLNTITTGFNLAQLNQNFTLIDTALQDAVSRSATTPNTFTADLDMNSQRLINLADPTLNQHAVTLAYGNANFGGAVSTAATAAAAAAAISETNAATSETNAATSETNAATSETNAAISETNAAASAATALQDVVEDLTPQLGGNLDVNTKSIVFPTTTISDVLDDDTMATPSDTKLATQQSIKAYVDTEVAAVPPPKITQIVHKQVSATSTGTTLLPTDDTIPQQSTDGDELFQQSFTPVSASSRLMIDIVVNLSGSSAANQQFGVAIYTDSVEAAIAAQGQSESSATTAVEQCIAFRHVMNSPGTSAIVFKVFAGMDAAGTTTFNSNTYGGKMASSITITEIAA